MSSATESSACEVYETDGIVVAFLGSWGSDGVLRHDERSGWTFHPAGSVAWDSFHQGVYRNHKGSRLTQAELDQRGIPPPPTDQASGAPAVAWNDQFNAEIPFNDVPPAVLEAVKAGATRERTVHLVLYEDTYETAFGDGCFLYPQAAFWTEDEAKAFLQLQLAKEAERPPNEMGYRYRIKAVSLKAHESGRRLEATLNLEIYEHYSVEDVVRLLAGKP